MVVMGVTVMVLEVAGEHTLSLSVCGVLMR